MKPLRVLREYLQEHFPLDVRAQQECTCGAGNHVRVLFFRVEGMPAAVVFPEGANVTAELMKHAIGTSDVAPLSEEELNSVYTESELGHMQPFENPFGASVYIDAALLPKDEIVFCPRMFFGQANRECFRVPLYDFLKLTRAQVIPITGRAAILADSWAV